MTSFAALRRPNDDIWRFQDWPVSRFGLFNQKKYLASKYAMSLNDTLYPSQEISPIFEMSQSESLHHFWWEFPPASLWEAWPPFKRPGLPLSYLKCLQMGGGGVKATLGKCSKGSSFFLGMTSLSRPRVCYQRNGATPLIFFKLAYILFSEIILLFPSCVCVCVFESVNRSLEWIFTIYQYVLLRLLVRWSWSTVNPCRSFTNGFVSQGSKNFPYF